MHDQLEVHKVLLDIESRFNAKSRGAFVGVQGSQIHALTMFAELFEQFPNPVVITAAVLKLADWFRTSNNIVRFYVYKVFNQISEDHLCQVSNLEETIRRILPVLGTNDPLARSLTLRILGCISVLIAEKIEVHHAILRRLEAASDIIEIEAAIWASDKLCAKSVRFLPMVFPIVESKLKDESIALRIKLPLVRMFRHMHRDMMMTNQAKASCLTLLDRDDMDEKLVIVTLKTLTQLLSETLVDRKEQTARLLHYIGTDNRENVRSSALYDLVLLVRNGTIVEASHIVTLLRTISSRTGSAQLVQKEYICAQVLIESHRQLLMRSLFDPDSSSSTVITIRDDLSYATDTCEQRLVQALHARRYATVLACSKFLVAVASILRSHKASSSSNHNHAMDVDDHHHPEEIVTGIKAMVSRLHRHLCVSDSSQIIESASSVEKGYRQVRELLRIKAQIVLLSDDACDDSFREAFGIMVTVDDHYISAQLLSYLATIACRCHNLSAWFIDMGINALKTNLNRPRLYVSIIRLLLRTIPPPSVPNFPETLFQYLQEFGHWNPESRTYTKNAWYLYVIGIEAALSEWYEVMEFILSDLSNVVESEASKYWISFLSLFAKAETCLRKLLMSSSTEDIQLAPVVDVYLQCLIQLKAFESLHGPVTLQSWFVRLRMEMISSIQDTLEMLNAVHVGTSFAAPENRKQAKLLHRSAIRFKELASRYDYAADKFLKNEKATMNVVNSFKVCALAIEHALMIYIKTSNAFFCIDPSLLPLLHAGQEEKSWQGSDLERLCVEFIKTVMEWEELDGLNIQDRQAKCTQDIRHFCKQVLRHPLQLPSTFFKLRKDSRQ